MKNPQELTLLFEKYLSGGCTAQETQELMDHFGVADDRDLLGGLIVNVLSSEEGDAAWLRPRVEQVVAQVDVDLFSQIKSAGRRPVRLWPRLVAAASVAAVLVLGIYFVAYKQLGPGGGTPASVQDIAPGKNGATLTLANGQKILISDALAGNIAMQSGVKISKTADGQLVYELTDSGLGEMAYNTLSTSRGEQTQVRLPDGTQVFLNAESSLRYPTNFSRSDKREVTLSGEGYFEVAKDKAHPFVVSTPQQWVEVLGTHFNINAYGGGERTRTTLIEGSVRVSAGQGTALLRPDQEAVLSDGSIRVADVDAELALDWKNGFFYFSSEPLESIMDRVARWYDVEVDYSDPSLRKETFTGTISRFKQISEVFALLQKAGGVRFTLEGKSLRVARTSP